MLYIGCKLWRLFSFVSIMLQDWFTCVILFIYSIHTLNIGSVGSRLTSFQFHYFLCIKAFMFCILHMHIYLFAAGGRDRFIFAAVTTQQSQPVLQSVLCSEADVKHLRAFIYLCIYVFIYLFVVFHQNVLVPRDSGCILSCYHHQTVNYV